MFWFHYCIGAGTLMALAIPSRRNLNCKSKLLVRSDYLHFKHFVASTVLGSSQNLTHLLQGVAIIGAAPLAFNRVVTISQ